MKAILTKVEKIGKTGSWLKVHFVNVDTGEAGNAILAYSKEIENTPIAEIGKDYSNDVDIDFNQQGRVSAITPLG